eukprot:scaffold98880_cov63-Phaeocystis_antarctica.AAC.2
MINLHTCFGGKGARQITAAACRTSHQAAYLAGARVDEKWLLYLMQLWIDGGFIMKIHQPSAPSRPCKVQDVALLEPRIVTLLLTYHAVHVGLKQRLPHTPRKLVCVKEYEASHVKGEVTLAQLSINRTQVAAPRACRVQLCHVEEDRELQEPRGSALQVGEVHATERVWRREVAMLCAGERVRVEPWLPLRVGPLLMDESLARPWSLDLASGFLRSCRGVVCGGGPARAPLAGT